MVYVMDYAASGPLTSLEGVDAAALEPVAGHPVEICLPVHALVIQPNDAQAIGMPPERFAENQLRPAASIVRALLALDPAPLSVAREPEKRVIGTCRHFAVLSCALLRYRDIPARVRCGFATYFQPGKGLDHWVAEYWDDDSARWVRIDSEVLTLAVLPHPEDLRPSEFLSGGEAWSAFRRGEIDGSDFGVYGTENWGAGEIRGNAVKDLAALNKVETLPWDVWGRMEEAYRGEAGAEYDELLDQLADVCAADDPVAAAALYARDELTVPPDLIC
jgi:Transglutaminase-like superfamily